METLEREVLLTAQCRGRLATLGSNSTSKRDRRKMYYVLKAGKKWFNKPFQESTYHSATISARINSQTLAFWESEDSSVGTRIAPSKWKGYTPEERLRVHFKLHAEYLTGVKDAAFTVKWIG